MDRYENPKLIPLEVAVNAVAAMRDAQVTNHMPLNGCGRVYVMIGYSKMLKSHAIAKVLVSMGFKVTPRPNTSGLALYVGYDNATGREWSRAHQYAETLKGFEIVAYADVRRPATSSKKCIALTVTATGINLLSMAGSPRTATRHPASIRSIRLNGNPFGQGPESCPDGDKYPRLKDYSPRIDPIRSIFSGPIP